MQRYGLFLVFLFWLICAPSHVKGFAVLNKLSGERLKEWLSTNEIKVKVTEFGEMWMFAITCPPQKDQEQQWGMSLHLKRNGIDIAEVKVKPRALTKLEWKEREGRPPFEFKVSKDLMAESTIMMYMEHKMPSDLSTDPHIYNAINLKDLLPAR